MSTRRTPPPRAAERRNAAARNLGSTRDRILTSAERLFAEQGFSDVTMPKIAEASGITAGAIYKHYASKADLFFQVIQRSVESTQLPATTPGPHDGSLPGIVAAYTTRRLKLLRQLSIEVHAASTKDPKVRRLLRRALDANTRRLRGSIEAGQRAGDLDPALDPTLLAQSVLVFIMGLMHLETLAPLLVGDPRWRDFVQGRTSALLGAPKTERSSST
jgi:AcrR family transcriptional regulator